MSAAGHPSVLRSSRRDVLAGELDPGEREHRRPLARVHRQVPRAELQHAPLGSHARDRQRGRPPRRERERDLRGQPREQRGEHGLRRGLLQRLQIVEDQHEAARPPLRLDALDREARSRPPGTPGRCRGGRA